MLNTSVAIAYATMIYFSVSFRIAAMFSQKCKVGGVSSFPVNDFVIAESSQKEHNIDIPQVTNTQLLCTRAG